MLEPTLSPNDRAVACADRSGAIFIAEACPKGMVPLGWSTRRLLDEAVWRCSRQSRGGVVWLVPGLREGVPDEAADIAVVEFQQVLREQLALRRAA